jgi:response regulator RpfG family c-di-GMP phosphodiesterase
MDYVVKPFDLSYVAETLDRAILKQRQIQERAKYLADLEATLEQQAGQLRATLAQIEEANEETLEVLAAALDARERETQAHSKRVSDYSVHLARELRISEDEIETIRQGAMLHDIGKIGIPDRILLKPGRLTAAEWCRIAEGSVRDCDCTP